MMKKTMGNEIISLNDKLFNEFSIEELEARLETDPLLLSTLFTGLLDDGGITTRSCDFKCDHYKVDCNEYSMD